jgi:tetratricopeptide (TPR) repeat protein
MGRHVLKPLAEKPSADQAMLLTLATAQGELADPDTEATYRKIIAMDGGKNTVETAAARNNLATVLLGRKNDSVLAEAESLSIAAADTKRNSADGYVYLDTLARIYLRERKFPDAVKAFTDADKINRNNLIIMIGLADTWAQSGNANRARGLLAQIDEQLRRGNSLSSELQQELDATRTATLDKKATPPTRSSLTNTDPAPAARQ